VTAVVAAAGTAACNDSSTLAPTSASGAGATEAKPGGAAAYQLNISHIECTEAALEIHFVLLHVPNGVALNQLTVTYGGTPAGSVGAEKNTGNVYHFTDLLPDWSGDVNITSASVAVPAIGGNQARTVTLHNPGAYAGFYDCAHQEQLCEWTPPAELGGQIFCLNSPLGSQTSECAFLDPSSSPTGGQAGGAASVAANQSGDVALVKDGAVGCSPGQQAYRLYLNVDSGDTLFKPTNTSGEGGNISHITYCSCPTSGSN